MTTLKDVTRPATRDLASIRRELAQMHSKLRSQGMSPVEALAAISRTLLGDGEKQAGLEFGCIPVGYSEISAIAFQEFISDDARSVFGQYLTPAVVAAHVADLLGEVSGKLTVLDPFMGSGILLDAISNVSPEARLFGCEINEPVSLIGRASIQLGGRNVHVTVADSFQLWRDGSLPKVDLVVTNPPFGAFVSLVKPSLMSETLAYRTVGNRARLPVELLALELSMESTSEFGQVAIVLPQSVLTNRSWSEFRRRFFNRYSLRHVTELPSATFTPFKGVARSCVLLIENRVPERHNSRFTYARSCGVGYDETGRITDDCDLPSIAEELRSEGLGSAYIDVGGELKLVRAGPSETGNGELRLGDIAEVFRGKNPSRDAYVGSGPFLLKVGSLSGSFVSWRDRQRTRVPRAWFEKSPARHLMAGDICLTASAHKASYIGQKVDLIDDVPVDGAMASAEVITIRLRCDAPISPVALLYYLRSTHGYEQIQRMVRGSTAHLYPKDLVELLVPNLESEGELELLQRLHESAQKAFRNYLMFEDEARSVALSRIGTSTLTP